MDHGGGKLTLGNLKTDYGWTLLAGKRTQRRLNDELTLFRFPATGGNWPAIGQIVQTTRSGARQDAKLHSRSILRYVSLPAKKIGGRAVALAALLYHCYLCFWPLAETNMP